MAFVIIAVVVPMNAAATVKSETIKVDDSTGFSFSLQLKEDELVFWEWDSTPEETGDDATTDFQIEDDEGDEVVVVNGKTSDTGSALIENGGTHYFIWEVEDDVMLQYTITYESMTDSVSCCGSVLAILGILAIIAVLGFAISRRK
jgi:hypothetical protein